jgi:dTDP-4-dehydrorhamnose reductase
MSSFSFDLLDHSHPILVFGRDGQVGKALQVCLSHLKVPVVYLGRADCDLTDQVALNEILSRHQPQLIINAAAYTAVDKAETDREHAFAINTQAPALMARYISQVPHGVLIHYSTDYVFADTKKIPYLEADVTGPIDQLCIYGQSKLAGEEAIKEAFNLVHASGSRKILEALSKYFILRTSWVYGEGNNFIRTILRLAAERDQLKVVVDQVGTPTSAQWLAEVGLEIARSTVESGIYHVVPDGEISWHGLAMFAVEIAASYGEGIEVKPENILPITTQEYPVAAKRPLNSRLSNQKFKKVLSEITYTTAYPHWQGQVEQYVKDYVVASLKS